MWLQNVFPFHLSNVSTKKLKLVFAIPFPILLLTAFLMTIVYCKQVKKIGVNAWIS